MKLINVGFYNFIPENRIVAIFDYNSTASRKIRELYRTKYPDTYHKYIIDFTKGRKTLSCILLDTGQIVTSIKSRKQIANIIQDIGSVNMLEEEDA